MAKKYRVTLTAEEREEWQALLAKGKASARKLTHARVLLQVDETATGAGRTDEETAGALHLSVRTVEHVRERFVEQGLAALCSLRRANGCMPVRLTARARRGSSPWLAEHHPKARGAGLCACWRND